MYDCMIRFNAPVLQNWKTSRYPKKLISQESSSTKPLRSYIQRKHACMDQSLIAEHC